MKANKPEWDEVVEDEMYVTQGFGFVNGHNSIFLKAFMTYLGISVFPDIPVRIKCRQGMIQIERIKE